MFRGMADAATTATEQQPCGHGGASDCVVCGQLALSVEPDRAFTLRLPGDLHAALTRRAKEEDRRLAQTARAALRAYLAS